MDLPGGVTVSQALILSIEQELQLEELRGWKAGWNLRVLNKINKRRHQYPYQGQLPSRDTISGAVSWMALTMRSAGVLQRSHEQGIPFNGNMSYKPSVGPGYQLYYVVTVQFSGGGKVIPIPSVLTTPHIPTRAEIEAHMDEQLSQYGNKYKPGQTIQVIGIEYTRLWTGYAPA